MSSGLASGGSAESIDVRAHSTRPGHIRPTRISGVSCRWRTCSSCQIIISLEHGADAAGRHDERVRGEHELVQPREEGLVLEGLLDERH